MADEIHLTAGDEAENVVAGKRNQQQATEQRADPRQSQVNNFSAQENNRDWLINLVGDHTSQIRNLTERLDDLPNKFIRLENRVDNQGKDVAELQGLRVVVRKEEVELRLPPPDAANVNMRVFNIAAIVIGALVVMAVASLIYVQYLIYLRTMP